MCMAYADYGLFVFMYLMCSLYLMLIPLPVCPIYFLLHVLHDRLYIPLGYVFSFFLLVICLKIVFLVRKAIPTSEFLNRLVIFLTSGLWYVKVGYFFIFSDGVWSLCSRFISWVFNLVIFYIGKPFCFC